MRHLPRISGAAVAALFVALTLAAPAAFAAVSGNIAGTVTDEATGKPLAGVTVTATSPALQSEQTEFTDGSGRYIITSLPPGEYVIRFYFSNIKVERPGVHLSADKTLPVNAAIPTKTAETKTYRIVERAPNIDVGNTQIQTTVTSETVRNLPVRGRTFESVLTLAPGAATDATGFTFNGATGPENNFMIDGMNTTNPSFGLIGTRLSLEFVGETEIITGGYNAEYGRAQGGVVNVITKSGSNDFHGGAWFNYQPFQLTPERIARTGEAIARTSKINNAFDFGFDIGGPILKDRIWFYAGFHPQFQNDEHARIVRRRTADDPAAAEQKTGAYAGDLDTKLGCPKWLDPQLCPSTGPATGPYRTVDTDASGKALPVRKFNSAARLYNYIAKLNFALNENNSLTLQYIGAPSTFDGSVENVSDYNPYTGNGFNGAPVGIPFKETIQVHDVGVRLVSKLLDRKLQIDLVGAWHMENYDIRPGTGGDIPSTTYLATRSLADFESIEPCKSQMLAGGASFNPCPVSSYSDGGFGFIQELKNQRWSAQAGLTYFARLAGTHALKLGGDFEDNIFFDHRRYSGQNDSGAVTVLPDGTVERQQFSTIKNPDSDMPEIVTFKDGFAISTSTLNYSLYLRDSWNVGFVPGLTVNAGVRWEAQQVRDPAGKTIIGIYDNIAPRVGFVYDWTQKGRSKIYASYGRFYESIPLDINDRSFSGEGFVVQDLNPGDPGHDACAADANGKIDAAKCVWPDPNKNLNGYTFGGTYASISPVLKGQYSNEIVAGLQYDVGLDLVLGAAYVHRDIGRVMEDVSADGAATYIIANPGEPTDPGVVADLQKNIDGLSKQIAKETDPKKLAALEKSKGETVTQLANYKAVESFDKPKRDYNALVITVNKRFSHNFQVLGSYTYSRTLGNYPGLFQASNGQLDPNITTQYDLKDLLVNRDGPLPGDRPHNLRLTGAYTLPLGAGGGITLGLSFSALSGRPIEVLGRHPIYGRRETFVLPRGSGGRTPTLTSFDLHLGYSRQFAKLLRVEVSWDIFNVVNQRGVASVEEEYSLDRVNPIVNGTPADLASLKTTNNGTQPRLNPNYAQPTAYQSPLTMRFGVRVSF